MKRFERSAVQHTRINMLMPMPTKRRVRFISTLQEANRYQIKERAQETNNKMCNI